MNHKHFKIRLDSQILPLDIEGLYIPEIAPAMNNLVSYQAEELRIYEIHLNGTPVWNLMNGEQIEALQKEILSQFRRQWEISA